MLDLLWCKFLRLPITDELYVGCDMRTLSARCTEYKSITKFGFLGYVLLLMNSKIYV